jgi:hypothetical protein
MIKHYYDNKAKIGNRDSRKAGFKATHNFIMVVFKEGKK